MSEKSAIPERQEKEEGQGRKDTRANCLEEVRNADPSTIQNAFRIPVPGQRGSDQTLLAFNDAFSKTPESGSNDQEEQTGGPNHTEITRVDGLIHKLTHRDVDAKIDNVLEITYQKAADGQTILKGEDGKPKIETVTGSIRRPGNLDAATINIKANSGPAGQRALSERISVDQKTGDLSIEEPDGNRKSTIRAEDFARVSHDRITTQNDGDAWRIRKVIKLNENKDAYVTYTYDYDDAHNRPEQLLIRNKHEGKDLVESMQLRNNDKAYNVMSFDTLSMVPTKRDVRTFDISTGEMAYSDREQMRYSDLTDSNVGSAAVVAARNKLINELKKHTDFTDTKEFNDWIDKIEGKKPSWMTSLRDKGWRAPDNKDIAGTYEAFRQFIVGQRSGLGLDVGNKDRVQLVLTGVRQFSDTWKFGGNQNDMPSCGRAALAGCCVRANPAQFYRNMAEAVNKGKVTYNGIDKTGQKVQVALQATDLKNTDQRCSIDELEQKVFARVMGSRAQTDNFGTNASHAKYVYHFFTGHNNLAVLDFNTRHPNVQHESTIHENLDSILKTLQDRSIWVMFPGHAERMENAKLLKNNQVELFITNSHKLDGTDKTTYSPGTGLFDPRKLGPNPLTVKSNVDYSQYFRKNKKPET